MDRIINSEKMEVKLTGTHPVKVSVEDDKGNIREYPIGLGDGMVIMVLNKQSENDMHLNGEAQMSSQGQAEVLGFALIDQIATRAHMSPLDVLSRLLMYGVDSGAIKLEDMLEVINNSLSN